jgi:hypothetical protein
MNPVGKDDKFREFIHSSPWNLSSLLNIFDHFERLGSLADGIRRMAGTTEIDIGNPCRTVSLHITMAEGAIQMGCLLMANMIETDGLVNGDPGEDGKDGEEGSFWLNGKSMVGHEGHEKNQDDAGQNSESLSHKIIVSTRINNLIQSNQIYIRQSLILSRKTRTGLQQSIQAKESHYGEHINIDRSEGNAERIYSGSTEKAL